MIEKCGLFVGLLTSIKTQMWTDCDCWSTLLIVGLRPKCGLVVIENSIDTFHIELFFNSLLFHLLVAEL
jgi:hypothetical protein